MPKIVCHLRSEVIYGSVEDTTIHQRILFIHLNKIFGCMASKTPSQLKTGQLICDGNDISDTKFDIS